MDCSVLQKVSDQINVNIYILHLLGNILILIIILFLYVYDDIFSGQCFLTNRDEISNSQNDPISKTDAVSSRG